MEAWNLMTINYDISEELPYDLSVLKEKQTFELTDIAYDIVIDNLPFIAKVGNQNQYIRQTAQYRKEQFDNSQEPGEQSLTGWWLRSQSSFHNGAGIGFYEPGTDKEHTSHRFDESRGLDVWEEGEAKPLKEVVHAFTGVSTADKLCATVALGPTRDAIIMGNALGELKKITLDGDNDITGSSTYISQYTLNSGHNSGIVHPFYSVTTDGTHYYALCSDGLHKGNVNGTTNDIVLYGNTNSDPSAFVKYAKGYLFGATGRSLYRADTNITSSDHHNNGGTAFPSGVNLKVHSNSSWKWNDLAAGTTHLYASGYSGNRSEIWSIAFDGAGSDSGQSLTSLPNLPGAFVSAQMPLGEIINCIEYYLGFLIIGTNKGIRIAQTGVNGDVAYGPVLFDSDYPITGLVANDRFVFASTRVIGDNDKTNACLVRVDLSQDFGDGTFAYAYDLEYQSSVSPHSDNSEATDVLLVDNRLVMVVQETEDFAKGELLVESLNSYRTNSWMTTGKIRFGTIEPKFFRFVNVKCETGINDSITINVIDESGNETNLANVTTGLSNIENLIEVPTKSQERMSFKFTFNNSSADSNLPILRAWQVKAIPAVRRQRLIQIPLSCFDFESDRYNVSFGYDTRALTMLQKLEQLEETGKFVRITDYRINETFIGVIEQVEFANETSPDRESSGFGGILTVTVRKI
jgi:hypothetical protein